MRKIIISFFMAVCMLGSALAQVDFRVTFSPTYDDGGTTYCDVGPGEINIYVHNHDRILTGWSTPWRIFALECPTGIQFNGPANPVVDPAFLSIWTMGQFYSQESWDGDLCNDVGGLYGDHWNFSGLTLSGFQPGPELLTFTFEYEIIDPGHDNELGYLCIDSGDFVDNTYDWLFDPPVAFGDSMCCPVKGISNQPPAITNCPGTDVSLQWHEQICYQFEFTDPDGPGPFTWSIDGRAPATIDENGLFCYNPDCSEVGSQTFAIELDDGAGGTDVCSLTVSVLNIPPIPDVACGGEGPIGINQVKIMSSYPAHDDNIGDVITYYAGIISAPPGGDASVAMIGQDMQFTSGSVTGDYVVEIIMEDCAGDTAMCLFTAYVLSTLPFDIVIEKEHGPTGLGVLQGHHVYVDVSKMRGSEEMHGFDLLIGYDASALTFMGAEQGQIMTDLEWEYFTYRFNWNGNCGSACPSGLLRAVAMAETNDGAHHPLGFTIPDGEALFTMDFLVTNDRNFECMFIPVYFYWHDCGDNTIAFHPSTAPANDIQTAVSEHVYQYGGMEEFHGEVYYEVTDMSFGFPTFTGVQAECLEGGGPDKPAPVPFVWFFGGGVDIICSEEIDERGDINLNGVANEIADAVVFTNYFIYGLSAFVVNVEGQIAATEVNGDGMVLSVADLVYLIRVIVGDALPIPKPTPAGDLQVVAGDMVTLNQDVGAAAFVFEGNADLSLAEGAAGMELISNFRDGMTYALIYTMNEGIIAGGNVLTVNGGNLVSVEAADYVGQPFEARILPRNFELAQNAPNPFNMSTSVKMALPVATNWTLSIYNVAGQRVLDYNGYSEAGIVEVSVDMTGLGSGIYFYKAEAGEFSATRKMVLLK